MTSNLASVDNQKLLRRSGTCEHNLRLGNPFLEVLALIGVTLFILFLVLKMALGELVTVDNNTGGFSHGGLGADAAFNHVVEFPLGVLDDVDLVGNGRSGWRLVTSDHDNLNTSLSALIDGQVDLGSGRIIQGDDTDQSQVVHRESAILTLVLGIAALESLAPLLPVTHVKLVSVGELAHVKISVGEGKHSLTELTEVIVGLLDLLAVHFIEISLLAVDKDLGATGNDALGRSLEIDTQVFAVLLHVADEQVELLV